MTDAERTSAQAEEQAQATESGGLLSTVMETARNVAGTVTETAKDVVETVTERTPEAISSAAAAAASTVGAVVDKVRDLGGDAPEG